MHSSGNKIVTNPPIMFSELMYQKKQLRFAFSTFLETMDETIQEKYWFGTQNTETLLNLKKVVLSGGTGIPCLMKTLIVFTKIDDLVVYTCGFYFIGPDEGWATLHQDGDTDIPFYNILIPVTLLPGSAPEIVIKKEESAICYQFHLGHAFVIQSSELHQTAKLDGTWEYPNDLRIMFNICIGPKSAVYSDKNFRKVCDFCTPYYPYYDTSSQKFTKKT